MVKAIAEHCKRLDSPAWSIIRNNIDMIRKMDTVILSNVSVFRKEWAYRGSSAASDAKLFYNRMTSVFDTLTIISSSWLCMSQYNCPIT